MIYLILIVAIFSVYQAVTLRKKKMTKEIFVSIGIALVALGMAVYYSSGPYRMSLAGYVLEFLNLNK